MALHWDSIGLPRVRRIPVSTERSATTRKPAKSALSIPKSGVDLTPREGCAGRQRVVLSGRSCSCPSLRFIPSDGAHRSMAPLF